MSKLAELQAMIAELAADAERFKQARLGFEYINVAHMKLDDRIEMGKRIALSEAELQRAQSLLRDAMNKYVEWREEAGGGAPASER